MSGRLVCVFWRADGSVLFHGTSGTGHLSLPTKRGLADGASSRGPGEVSSAGASSASQPLPNEPDLSASTVWSLVKVFIQFSREVEGGNVRRLVFRDPVQSVGKRRGFGGVPENSGAGGQRPILIYVAHDALFAVTVTETVAQMASELRPPPTDFPAAAFSRSVLEHFASAQASFLETSAAQNGVHPEGSMGRESVSSGTRARTRSDRHTGESASPYGASAPGGRNDGERSFGSEDSVSSFASSLSEYYSNGGSSFPSDNQMEAPAVEVAPMMPIDKSSFGAELQQILVKCLEQSVSK